MRPMYSFHLGAWFSRILPLWVLLVGAKIHVEPLQKVMEDENGGIEAFEYSNGDRRSVPQSEHCLRRASYLRFYTIAVHQLFHRTRKLILNLKRWKICH